MATVTFDKATRIYPSRARPRRSTRSTSRSTTASSSCSSARRAAGSRRRCGCSPASNRSTSGCVFIGDTRRHDGAAAGPRHRDGVPELRAVPAHDGRREHRLPPEDQEGAEGRDRNRRVHEAARAARPRRVPRSQAGQAVGRAAPARGDGPRDRAPAAGVPDGRAAVEPRRQAPRADPHPDRCAAAPTRRHHRLRDPRPGRGDDHGRPGGGAQGRRAPAVRATPRAVHAAGQHCSSPASSARRR